MAASSLVPTLYNLAAPCLELGMLAAIESRRIGHPPASPSVRPRGRRLRCRLGTGVCLSACHTPCNPLERAREALSPCRNRFHSVLRWLVSASRGSGVDTEG